MRGPGSRGCVLRDVQVCVYVYVRAHVLVSVNERGEIVHACERVYAETRTQRHCYVSLYFSFSCPFNALSQIMLIGDSNARQPFAHICFKGP
jgi:hypothetical protein